MRPVRAIPAAAAKTPGGTEGLARPGPHIQSLLHGLVRSIPTWLQQVLAFAETTRGSSVKTAAEYRSGSKAAFR